ncbi:FAD binding domain-containing protein [Cognatishimia sp. SS12]|uniref:FAD binding domain-containing protein n=1 Tax=Cognatishimia sp. SS12 TaxID=2979465 RepID=UPI00232B1D41|nr:FAD binding domain-containing protein [Cognatishimia sp. SS12]MDC0738058.1 FAD binding domain-containing protein [Cognatishimia sp. SS12]
MTKLDYHRADSVEDAVRERGASASHMYLAGGQTLLNLIKTHAVSAEMLIDISRLGLNKISRKGDVLSIGAGATHTQISQDPAVLEHLPALARLAACIGDNAVRNRGTLGGAVANNDPSGDYPAALLALGARIETTAGTTDSHRFFGQGPTGDLILAVHIPLPERAAFARIQHQASRSCLVGVFVAEREGKRRFVASGCFADGAKEIDIQTPIDDLSAVLDDSFGSAKYRAHLVHVLAKRALLELES